MIEAEICLRQYLEEDALCISRSRNVYFNIDFKESG